MGEGGRKISSFGFLSSPLASNFPISLEMPDIQATSSLLL